MLVTISYKIQAVNHPLCPPWKLKIVLMTEPKVNRRTPKGYKDQGQHLATEKTTSMSLSETLAPMEKKENTLLIALQRCMNEAKATGIKSSLAKEASQLYSHLQHKKTSKPSPAPLPMLRSSCKTAN